MKTSLLLLALLLAPVARAQISLPKIATNQELCYLRVYTQSEIDADHAKTYEGNPQRVKGVMVAIAKGPKAEDALSVTIRVRSTEGKDYRSKGMIMTLEDRTVTKFTGGSARAQMETSDGEFRIRQSQINRDWIRLTVPGKLQLLFLADDSNETPPIEIQKGDSDDTMRLEWQHSHGSARSCEETFELALAGR